MESRYPYKLVSQKAPMLQQRDAFDPWFEDKLRDLLGDTNPTLGREQGFIVVNFMGEDADLKLNRALSTVNSSGIARAESPDAYLKASRVTLRSQPAINAGVQMKVSPTEEARKQYESEGKMNEWRTAGDPPIPTRRTARGARTRPPRDATYGSEPDLLDKAGTIVEPDVRLKISRYFKDMHLRESEIRDLVREILYIESKRNTLE